MRYLLLLLTLVCTLTSVGQSRVSVGFWNVENLFDTINNPFTRDDDFTPTGTYRWNTVRYNHKLVNLARVLDDMALDVVGLAEVENETVLRDLVRAMKTDYAYVFRRGNDQRGINQALLYKGDKFFPDTRGARLIPSHAGRSFLYVRGKLCGRRVDLVVVHMPSNLNGQAFRRKAMNSLGRFADSLQRADPAAQIVLMGDMNAGPEDRIMREAFGQRHSPQEAILHNPFRNMARRGVGTYVYNDRWLFYDNILLGLGLQCDGCGVFIREYLLTAGVSNRRGYPLRTFSGAAYLDGYSDHLPVFITLVL